MKLPSSIIVQALLACAYARPSCDSSEYFDPEEQLCKMCSMECPFNQVILEPCGAYTDTECGHFDFNWPPVQKLPKEDKQSEKPPVKSAENHKTDSLYSDQWFTIAMVLLGILCFVCVCITGYIIVVCFCKKSEDKEIIYDPVFMQTPPSEEPRYVEIFQSSRDRLKGRNPLMPTNAGRFSTFQSTSALPLLHSQNSANIYVNCMEYLPDIYSTDKSKDTNDYVYLESN